MRQQKTGTEKLRDRTERSFKEADVRKIEMFCSMTSLLTIVLSFLFMSGILQNLWVLNFILIVGILMNLSAVIVALVREQSLIWGLCLLLAIVQAAALIYLL